MNKKKILFQGNHSVLNTGFGGVKKRIMRWFFKRGWEIIECSNGLEWDAPELKRMPWKAYGMNPSLEQRNQINSIQDAGQRDAAMRSASYGLYRIDEVMKLEKPQIQYFCEDSWGFGDIFKKPWAQKTNPYFHCTIDSKPLLDSQIELGLHAKNLLVWASFAEKLYHEKGYNHVRTLPGCIDPEEFYPIPEDRRNELRKRFNLQNQFVTLFLGRSQLRKQFPNLLDGFKLFKDKNPNVKAKLIFHCSWVEGWPLAQLIQEKDIDPNDVLTTYYCRACRGYEIRPFTGQPLDCPLCGAKQSFNTTDIVHGVGESDLCDIYGLSDLVINPISSGGFEMSSFQAKMCGKILATTSYSCGLDACSEESAGIPLDWEAYTEANTVFTKSTTKPLSICDSMEKVFFMPKEEKAEMEKKARDFAVKYCSTDAVCEKLEKMFLEHPEAELLDSDFEPQPKNISHIPPNNLSPEEFAIDILQNMMLEKVDLNTSHVKNWATHLRKSNDYQGVYNHFQKLALEFNAGLNNKPVDLSELLDKDDEGKRLAIVIPESAGDVIMINSMLRKFKALYPDQNIYFFTRPEFFSLIEGHESIHRIMEYSPVVENMFFMTGNGTHNGYFNFAFFPHNLSQRTMSYQNGNTEARAEWLG